MKKILYLVIVVILLVRCDKYEMVQYDQGARINFVGDMNWANPGTFKEPYWSDDVELKYSFNFGINKQGEYLRYDTVQVGVKIMGDIANVPRKVALTTKSSEENVVNVLFPDAYYVDADTTSAVFRIVIERPAVRGTECLVELTFDYENSDFEEGLEERQVIELVIQDVVSKESWGGR